MVNFRLNLVDFRASRCSDVPFFGSEREAQRVSITDAIVHMPMCECISAASAAAASDASTRTHAHVRVHRARLDAGTHATTDALQRILVHMHTRAHSLEHIHCHLLNPCSQFI